MSTTVWTTLITAVATVTAALGAVWIKGHYDDRTQVRQAQESRSAARQDQQRQAYGDLVKTARLALRNFRQLLLAYATDTPDIPAVKEAFNQTAALAADMNQAAAVAELVGSPSGRRHAKAIYDKARSCADLFQTREFILAAAPNSIPGRLYGNFIPGGIAKTIPFDADDARIRCDELEAAIAVDVVTVELETVQDPLPLVLAARRHPADEATGPQHRGRVDGGDRRQVVGQAQAQRAVQPGSHGRKVTAGRRQLPHPLLEVHALRMTRAAPGRTPTFLGSRIWDRANARRFLRSLP